MAELDDEDIAAYENALHPAVRAAYAEERLLAAAHIKRNIEAGRSWVQEALTWVPYVDAVFDEETGPAAAASDINIFARAADVTRKIEAALGETLDEDTRRGIQQDVTDIWGL